MDKFESLSRTAWDSFAIALELLDAPNPPELVLVTVRPSDRPTAWKNLAVRKDKLFHRFRCPATQTTRIVQS